MVSGYLIQSFGWREMFIIEGVPAIIWAFCWWVLVKDKPAQAKWLSEDEKAALQAQLDKEQQGLKGGTQLRRSLPLRQRYPALRAVLYLEYWRVRLCAVAAVDYPQRRRKPWHGGSGLALPYRIWLKPSR